MSLFLTLHHLTPSCVHWMDKLPVTGESGMSGFGVKWWSQSVAENAPTMCPVLLEEEGLTIV